MTTLEPLIQFEISMINQDTVQVIISWDDSRKRVVDNNGDEIELPHDITDVDAAYEYICQMFRRCDYEDLYA